MDVKLINIELQIDKTIVLCIDYKLLEYKQRERQPNLSLLTHIVFFFLGFSHPLDTPINILINKMS